MNDECTEFLEKATRSLQDRIVLLEKEEKSLLHQNLNSQQEHTSKQYSSKMGTPKESVRRIKDNKPR